MPERRRIGALVAGRRAEVHHPPQRPGPAAAGPGRHKGIGGGLGERKRSGAATAGDHDHQLRRPSSPRGARALYERLGYQAFGRELESWDVEAEDGSLQRYETMCTLMRKDLA